MANRGLLRGIGVNPPLGKQTSEVYSNFIQGSYPAGHWIARVQRPSWIGNFVVNAPQNATIPAIKVQDTFQTTNLATVRSLFLATDGSGTPLYQLLNAGGAFIYGDKISGQVQLFVGQPAGIDGTTNPASLYGGTGGGNPERIYFVNGVPSGATLPNVTPHNGDWALNQASTSIYNGLYQYISGTWTPFGLATTSATLGANTALSASPTTLSTLTLAVGTWLVHGQALYFPNVALTSNSSVTTSIAAGTGVGSLFGPSNQSVNFASGAPTTAQQNAALATLVSVTTAGTFLLQAGAGNTQLSAFAGGYTGAVAVRVA